MTRKRKNVEADESGTSTANQEAYPQKKYQYQPKKEEEPSSGGYGDNFSKQYGYVGGGGATEVLESTLNAGGEDVKESPFPTEIVTYLRNIENVRQAEGKLEDFILDKCAEECSGEEATLLSFRDACVVVEKVFGSSSHGATAFLRGLSRLKHKRLLDLIFCGCAATTMERLIYAISPVTSNEQIEVLSKLTDLLCDNWSDAVCTQSSAFLIRCLARVTCGLPAKQNKPLRGPAPPTPKPVFSSPSLRTELRRLFDRIGDLCVDPHVTGGLLDQVECSLVVQDVVDADAAVSAGKAAAFVEKALRANEDDPSGVLNAWNGKNSSRVWEKLMEKCNDETRRKLWDAVIHDKVSSLASHLSANFPLQKFISSTRSQQLATSISESVCPLIPSLLAGNRSGVVESLIRCTQPFAELQESLLKQLRTHFRSNKKDNKTHFFFNVLSMNAFDGTTFNVETSKVPGSLLIDALCSLSKVKTISACFESMSYQDIHALACHKVASHALQSVLRSSTIEADTKSKIISAFSDSWEDLISHPIGSHAFEAMWDSPQMDVRKKQELMKAFVAVRNPSKGWKFAMLRCDMFLFRKDRKAWVEKMKKWKPFVKPAAAKQ